ncbi:MAG TPA: tRNA (N6-isopentenyl adenosine(37)-C2)-methylthiotransferase MiaB [Parachlamydiaceae bacterium]|nr:tRNA (N6-isopentenyl adenosine(37)-C2)-methylthiotransferase MiaB [Parachlamydiaceae bacterium]
MRELKTFFVKTYGCQMNELDSDIMKGQLENRGLKKVGHESEADLLIVNTCSIRDLAERKAMGKLGIIGKANNPSKNAVIGVTGCMANAKKEGIFEKLPHVDFVLGTNNLHNLNETLDEVLTENRKILKTDDEFKTELDYLEAKRDDKVRAYVSIIRGCDKFCTYCVVPYTRGKEVSRNPSDILEECKKLALSGYKEITLLGQNVNSYGKDKPENKTLFHDLLYEIDKIDGIERVRFMTSHPVDITRELMEAIRDLKSLCEFVHFPLQAGSNRILKKMHRIYTVEQYLEKVCLLKEIVPNVALGSDFIVGFPTETDEEFEETCRLLEQINFSVSYSYAYSKRKGTPAMRFLDDIPEDVKEIRLQRLMSIQEKLTQKHLQNLVDTTVEVLVDGKSTKDASEYKGKSRCWKNVVFKDFLSKDKDLMGTLQKVKIKGYTHQTLIGTNT